MDRWRWEDYGRWNRRKQQAIRLVSATCKLWNAPGLSPRISFPVTLTLGKLLRCHQFNFIALSVTSPWNFWLISKTTQPFHTDVNSHLKCNISKQNTAFLLQIISSYSLPDLPSARHLESSLILLSPVCFWFKLQQTLRALHNVQTPTISPNSHLPNLRYHPISIGLLP